MAHITVPQQQPFFIPASAWGRDEPAYVLGLYILPNSCFISPRMAQPHWKLNPSAKLGVLSRCVGPFPACDGTASVLMSRAVVIMIGSKTSYVCRSSVRNIRGGMTFLHFMSVSLNDSGHLCTYKLGHFFSFLLLLALDQRKEGSLLSAISWPIVFSTKHFILQKSTFLWHSSASVNAGPSQCLSPQYQVSLSCDISSGVPLRVTSGCLGWRFFIAGINCFDPAVSQDLCHSMQFV